MVVGPGFSLVLVHGIFCAKNVNPAEVLRVREQCYQNLAGRAADIGLGSYEVIDGRGRSMANRFLQRARGTAPTVDLVEILSVDEQRLRDSLDSESGRALWQDFCCGGTELLDTARSFIVMGGRRQLVQRDNRGQRVFWFGNGLEQLSRSEFIEHYTGRHGPLVAGYAACLGLNSYFQVPDEQQDLCESLRDLGLGQGPSPATVAELRMGMPPLSLAAIRERRIANAAIKADEKRHINFAKSMLFLSAG